MADEVTLAKGKQYFEKFKGLIASFIAKEEKTHAQEATGLCRNH